MVALNFSNEFADKVERREKRQTIRQSCRARVGDALQLYTGQRTKFCRKLSSVDPVCTRVARVTISPFGLYFDGHLQCDAAAERYAELDGFESWSAMLAWFQARYGMSDFSGFEIRWDWP